MGGGETVVDGVPAGSTPADGRPFAFPRQEVLHRSRISSLALIVLLAGAKLGGALAERLGQPAVLGELVAGVALGALPLAGLGALD